MSDSESSNPAGEGEAGFGTPVSDSERSKDAPVWGGGADAAAADDDDDDDDDGKREAWRAGSSFVSSAAQIQTSQRMSIAAARASAE